MKRKLNYLRTFPVYLCVLSSRHRALIEMDLARWSKQTEKKFKGMLPALNWFLTERQEFRNLLLHRLWNPTRTFRAKIHAFITRRLWKPLESLYLCTREIGGGLYIQHGFATIVSAKKIGDNCWINQQVTIGYKGDDNPVLMDGVKVHCGAKVVGKVTMYPNSVAGANAVVVKDVPENAVVGGIPAKIIKYRSPEEIAL